MKRMFDFLCADKHVSEHFVDDSVRVVKCPECGKEADRLVSAPQVSLEGFSGAFPDAYAKWDRVRAEKQAIERKRNS